MHQHAERADGGEGEEAQRHDPAEQLVQQQGAELRQHQHVELALAGHPLAELVRDLDHPQRPGALSTRSSRILKPFAVSRGARSSNSGPPQHEEAAHRVGKPDRHDALGEPNAELGQRVAPAGRQAGGIAALDVTAAHREIERAGRAAPPACRQPGLVVLQVAVHHGDKFGRGGQRALDHRRGKAPPAHATDAADARIGRGDPARLRRRAVGAVVVDEHDLPGDARRAQPQAGDTAGRHSPARCSRGPRRSAQGQLG